MTGYVNVVIDAVKREPETRARISRIDPTSEMHRQLTDFIAQIQLGGKVIKAYETNVLPHLAPASLMVEKVQQMRRDHPGDPSTHKLFEELERHYESINKSLNTTVESLQGICQKITQFQ